MAVRSKRGARALCAALLFSACGPTAAPAPFDGGGDGSLSDAGTDASPVVENDAGIRTEGLAVFPVRPTVLVDTRGVGSCGAFAAIDAAHAIELDLDACTVSIPAEARAVALSWTILPQSEGASFEARVAAPSAIADGLAIHVGPADDRTHSGIVDLDEARTLRITGTGDGSADVVVEVTAFFAPPAEGARGVVFLPRPIRLYTARWDEAGVWHGPTRADVDERLALNEIAEEPLGALPADVVGLIGVAHVAPDGLCEPGSFVSLGPARAEGEIDGLARIATCGPESHFPSRSSTAFMIGASGSQQLVLRANGADAGVYLDVVGYLVPRRAGTALRHRLSSRLGVELALDETPRLVTGAPEDAVALSGHLSAVASGWGELSADADGTIEGPSGPFTTLSLRGDTSARTAFTTRLDDARAFVLASDTPAQLTLLIDAYWSIDTETP